jgi:hypothetical protein
MEGNPITGAVIAGRREAGGPDVPLSQDELERAVLALSLPQVAYDASLPRGTVGEFDTRSGQIRVSSTRNEPAALDILAHELGHAVDRAVSPGLRPTGEALEGRIKDARSAYSIGAGQGGDPKKRYAFLRPEDFGYSGGDVSPELAAEALRAYLTNPGWFKENYSGLAEKLRRAINNRQPGVTLNSLAAALVGAVPAAGLAAAQGERERAD